MTNIDIYDALVKNREHLLDVAWLAEFLKPHCKYKMLGWRGSRLRMIQYPTEFAEFLVLMAKHDVKSYLEIGTSTGGSFTIADSYLRAAVPGYERSVGYDRSSKMRDWAQYKERFPTAVFRHEGSGSMNLGKEQFGAAFIDARHVERWVMQDYNKVRNNCRLVGFHDIVHVGSTVNAAWLKIAKLHRNYWEFVEKSIPEAARCGIGVVETGS